MTPGVVEGWDADGNPVRLELEDITVIRGRNVRVIDSYVTLLSCRVDRADRCHITLGTENVIDGGLAASMEGDK